MTSGYTPGSMPEKDQPGFDQILRALREGLNEIPRLKEMPAEEVARQLARTDTWKVSPLHPWSRRLSKAWRLRSRVCRTTSFPLRRPTPPERCMDGFLLLAESCMASLLWGRKLSQNASARLRGFRGCIHNPHEEDR